MILMNCSDLEKFGAMLEQPELKQWDIDNNCVDTVYNLGLVEQMKKDLEKRDKLFCALSIYRRDNYFQEIYFMGGMVAAILILVEV